MCFYFILFHFEFFCLFVWLRKKCELSIIRIYVGCTSHTLLLRGCKRDYVQIFKKTTMPIDNFATSCSKSWLSLWYIRDSYKKKKKMQSRQGSSPPIVSALAPDLTKKRQGVNPWLLLYVYVLHTGYSKIGLLLAGQLHAQRQLVLLYQALFGQAWSETGYKPHPCKKNCPQGFRWSAAKKQSSWVSALRAEGEGGFNSCDVFTLCGVHKKKKNNMMWLCRLCTRQLPICACLSPFLHIWPFSDLLLNTNYLCKRSCGNNHTFSVYQMTHLMSVRAGSWETKGNGPKQYDSPKGTKCHHHWT